MKMKRIILLLISIIFLNSCLFLFRIFTIKISILVIEIIIICVFVIIVVWYGYMERERKYQDGDRFLWQLKALLGILAIFFSYIFDFLNTHSINETLLVTIILNSGIYAIVTCKSSSIIPPLILFFTCFIVSKYPSAIVRIISLFVAVFFFLSIFLISIDLRVRFISKFKRSKKKTFKLTGENTNVQCSEFERFWIDNQERIVAISTEEPTPLMILYRMDDDSMFISYKLSDGEIMYILNPQNVGKFSYLSANSTIKRADRSEKERLIVRNTWRRNNSLC